MLNRRPKHTSPRTRRVAALLATGLMALGAAASGAVTGSDPGTITSVAGATVDSRQYGFSGDGGPASSAQLYHPRAIAFDRAGNAFVADTLNQRIRRIDTEGTITTVAGNGMEGFGGDGGPALQATMNQPHGVAVDAAGNVYIADSANHRIRRVDRQGVITTVAGNGTPDATGDDGPARAALVKDPKTLATDPGGKHLYIADTGNNRIRRIDLSTGIITTVAGVTRAGADGDGGPAARAALNSPRGLWVTRDGAVFIADTDNHRIRKVDADGTISTVAGTGTAGFSGDGGPAGQAQLNDPRAVAVDRSGNIYVGEELGQRVRRVDPSGTITTIAGNGTAGFGGDGGPASAAQVDHIRALSLDSQGNLWIADTFNNRVRVISSPGSASSAPSSTTSTTTAATSPPPSSPPTTAAPKPAPAPRRSGYWMLGSDGRIFAFGDAKTLGDASTQLPPDAKAIHLEPTPTSNGYWILDNRGDVFAFGDAASLGGAAASELRKGEKVTSLSSTPSGKGYWIFTNRGRVLTVGDATHFGDESDVDLNGPVLNSIATPSGRGYYMVASDGGVFTHGDARFHGSMGATPLNAPVQSLVPNGDRAGYWLVASDGGIFAFGSSPFRGSMGDKKLNKPVVGMVRYGNGYLMVAADGGIFNFSDRPFSGSLGADPPDRPIVAVATLDTP
ncbi:MAG: NHL repeat-containing protein [Actinomycetota bacterium]|nr:NHL repeat-containing protein [Actinomycetota bacterium]